LKTTTDQPLIASYNLLNKVLAS